MLFDWIDFILISNNTPSTITPSHFSLLQLRTIFRQTQVYPDRRWWKNPKPLTLLLWLMSAIAALVIYPSPWWLHYQEQHSCSLHSHMDLILKPWLKRYELPPWITGGFYLNSELYFESLSHTRIKYLYQKYKDLLINMMQASYCYFKHDMNMI